MDSRLAMRKEDLYTQHHRNNLRNTTVSGGKKARHKKCLLNASIFMKLLLSRFSHVRLCATPQMTAPQGSPVPGILQARTVEWVAISFSNAWKWKVKVKSLSRARLFETLWTAAYQATPSVGFSRQEYWSGVPLPSPHPSLVGNNSLMWLVLELSILHRICTLSFITGEDIAL